MHRAGVEHQVADALSRLPTTGEDQAISVDDVSVLAIEMPVGSSLDDIIQDESEDAYIPNEATEQPSDNAPRREYDTTTEQATDSYRCAIRLYICSAQSKLQTDSRCIPVQKSLLEKLIQIVVSASPLRKIRYLCRYPPIAIHPGQGRTYNTLRPRF